MLIGVPKEIKPDEHRVGLSLSSARELIEHGHQLMVETGAGEGLRRSDGDYRALGARIADSAEDVFAKADLIVKVKEPQASECRMLREGQVLFTYLHLAPDPGQARRLMESGVTAIAYETVTDRLGQLPLLAPMSEVAGRMAVQAGARCLETEMGGCGKLLGGVPGVLAANVVVLGGGVVGTNALRIAVGMEARVVVLDKSLARLRELDLQFGARLNTVYSTRSAIEEYVEQADLVIGAVLVPGASTPRLVSRGMVDAMAAGSVAVDVAIDQGGTFETSRPTTHSDPTFIHQNVVHYCVANMPGAVPRTSTQALNNATLPFALALADKGWRQAMRDDPGLMAGLNVHAGRVTNAAVAEALDHAYTPPENALDIH
ncbi:MAG: alanine dehydrogenase [Gammaproteobacteria bacterium]|nr:alanine dehydrogenase [Gammaproteobacteria bacterium]MCY4165396.1 alanine dehydrogenase [Gammaproteobacteria bacterium]MCY4255617.1 alanine dehydrogenase [Gammaproteobacteria bacterium]MCY4341602.1 alanine dehydrogenase [Gammaproteobacteria bacterium]